MTNKDKDKLTDTINDLLLSIKNPNKEFSKEENILYSEIFKIINKQ